MSRAPHAARAVLAALLIAASAGACAFPARASTEEFSTFDILRQQEDDESVLDHELVRFPVDWRSDWARAPLAFHTTQGCLTSGQWLAETRLRASTPMSRHARFAVDYTDVASDVHTYQNLDLWFLFPQPVGTLGVMFRPYYDKSRQDFALAWNLGADSTADQLRLIWGFEDLFNNFWAWRQTRVGEHSVSYVHHPWEPALQAAVRRPGGRLELEGRYLTPSRKVVSAFDSTPATVLTLWGTWFSARAELRAFGVIWSAATTNRQAAGTTRLTDPVDSPDGYDFRRQWTAEVGARRAFGRRWDAEARWFYQDGRQQRRPPLGPATFHAVDRLLHLELRWAALPTLDLRAGGMFDRAGIGTSAVPVTQLSQGTRNESRFYVGLSTRFGRVRTAGVEGVELDPEPYDVWHHHDKGFLQLQALF